MAVDLAQHPDTLRWSQFLSALCTFLLPSIGIAWLCSENPSNYLSLKELPDSRIWGMTFLAMLLVSPFITLLGTWNAQMSLPEFMAPIEEWMRTREDLAEHFTKILLTGDSLTTLLSNLVVVAAFAGLTEEFLFRGALQRVIEKCTSNPHTVIWLTAILFSAFHLQFYGFVPRMILGAYFGYLLYWSKSIWLPIFAHFTNNAIAVIASYSDYKENEFVTGDIQPEHLMAFTIVSIGFLCLFLLVNHRLKRLL